jgi:hypothetical protein
MLRFCTGRSAQKHSRLHKFMKKVAQGLAVILGRELTDPRKVLWAEIIFPTGFPKQAPTNK